MLFAYKEMLCISCTKKHFVFFSYYEKTKSAQKILSLSIEVPKSKSLNLKIVLYSSLRMPITDQLGATCTLDKLQKGKLQKIAKIPRSVVRKLVRLGKVNGQLNPLSVDKIFLEDLKSQTEEQGGLDEILYFWEAARLITQANVTTLKINGYIMGDAVKYGLSIDQRLVDPYQCWIDEEIEVNKYRVKIKDDAFFYYKWGGENIESPKSRLLKKQAINELIGIFIRYHGVQILRKPAQKRGSQIPTISLEEFKEKHSPNNRRGANIECRPLVFIYGKGSKGIIYTEESKGKPKNHGCSDYDSSRIQFASTEISSKFLEAGLNDWSRIARYEYNGRNYGVFFFQISNPQDFKLGFPMHLSLIIDRYLEEGHYKLLEDTTSNLLGKRSQHFPITDKDTPEWFIKLIGLYEKYRKIVYE